MQLFDNSIVHIDLGRIVFTSDTETSCALPAATDDLQDALMQNSGRKIAISKLSGKHYKSSWTMVDEERQGYN